MPLIEETPLTTVDHLPRRRRRVTALTGEVAAAGVVGGLCSGVWRISTDNGELHARAPYSWPRWALLSLVVLLSVRWAGRIVGRQRPGPGRKLTLHAVGAALAVECSVLVWAFAGGGYELWHQWTPFWPKWVVLGFLLSLTVHAVLLLPVWRSRAERALTSRVDELTRTRRGVLDVQTVELRRIERDLHDGAQARLVALTLTLGRAERRLRDHPEAAALVRQARLDADLAIAELRELARGIAPPILTDRGLVEAVQALGRRAGIAVAVRADVPRRLPATVELAGYFITAEALTNVVKHAGTPTHPATATVTLDVVGATLVVQVADDGPGGADPHGAGLAGLAQRAAALDGTLTVGDLGDPGPPGGSMGGTVVRAELPCGW